MDKENRIKANIDLLHQSRGRFMHSYSQIEYLLLDIIKYLKDRSPYNALEIKFQNSLDGRAKSIRKMISIDGPFARFGREVEAAVSVLEVYNELRNFLAHGAMTMGVSSGGSLSSVSLRRYNPKAKTDKLWEPDYVEYDAGTFTDDVQRACEALNSKLPIIRKIYHDLQFLGPEPLGEFTVLR